MYTVLSGQKPARPAVGAILSGLSLIGALALGGALAHIKASRSRVVLGEPVAPPGWGVSFQPPEGWSASSAADGEPEYGLRTFSEPGPPNRSRELVLVHAEVAPCEPAVSVAADLVRGWAAAFGLGRRGLWTSRPGVRPFGPLPGAELEFRAAGLAGLARVGVRPEGAAICAMLLSPGGGSPRRTDRILDQFAQSVRYLGPPIEPADRPGFPFHAPPGTLACQTYPDSILPRVTLFPDPRKSESWTVLLWETWLIDDRRPEDLLRDIAREHLRVAEPPAEPSRVRIAGGEGWRLMAPGGEEQDASHAFWLRNLGDGRVVAAIAGYASEDQSKLERAIDTVVGSYKVGGRRGPSPTDAVATAKKVISQLPDELTKVAGEGETDQWELLFRLGRPEGFARLRTDVGVHNDVKALHTREDYVRQAAAYRRQGRYESYALLDGGAYELNGSWETTLGRRATRGSWQESRSAGDSVQRTVDFGKERLESTFRPGELFVPQTNADLAVYLTARLNRLAAFTTTADNWCRETIGTIVEPVDANTFDEFDTPEGVRLPKVLYAARLERDCQPDAPDLLGFDAQGHVVRAHFAGGLSLVACSRDEVLSRYPEAADSAAGPRNRP